jgi:hypothetical protein
MEIAASFDNKCPDAACCGAIIRGRAIASAIETYRENSLGQHGTVMYLWDPSTARH